MKVVELAKDLIKIPSSSGDEKEVGTFLVERLKKNFNVKIQKIGNRFNILATKGNPKIILTTHMDTVPNQLEIKEDDEWIYGRGTCDAKGLLACMICACEEAIRLGFNNFGILLDVSEETDFSGVKEAIKLVKPEVIIVGEPTNFKVVFGQKGLIKLKVVCRGKSAPGSTPERGVSAINQLIDTLQKVQSIEFPEDKLLGETTFNIGKVKGGSASNVVADYAEATIEIRTTKPNKEILKILRQCIPKKNIIIECNFEPVLVSDTKIIRQLNRDKIIVPYFTEMYFWIKKAKTVVFGPGRYEFAHTEYEKIRKRDLEKGAKIYLDMIKEFCR